MADPMQKLYDLQSLKQYFTAQLNSVETGKQEEPEALQYGDYVVNGDGGFIQVDNTAQKREHATNWKLHVSIDPSALDKAWRLYAELAVGYGIDSFKVVDRANPGDGKQITIYCTMRDKRKLSLFLSELEEIFRKNNIAADSAMSEDCSVVSGSQYISFRYEAFDYSLSKSSINGAPKNYLSDTHMNFAKEILRELRSDSNEDFEATYSRVLARNERISDNRKAPWFRKYQSYKKRGILDPAIFKQELKLIVAEARKFTNQDQDIPWYNLQSNSDTFGLMELDLAVRSLDKAPGSPILPGFDHSRAGSSTGQSAGRSKNDKDRRKSSPF